MTDINVDEKAAYKSEGYLCMESVFKNEEIDSALNDAMQWQDIVIGKLEEKDKKWYVDHSDDSRVYLRKLDNPVFERRAFLDLARHPKLIEIVEGMIGKGLVVFFSQLFFKPPSGGGPKPAHQDNFYFGPEDSNKIITAWIALDDATEENGCLYYYAGSHLLGLLPHDAPKESPYNLQISDLNEKSSSIKAAPVKKGGVCLHHGATIHFSAYNRSKAWRRAVAIHYMHESNQLSNSAFYYDKECFLKVS